MFNNLKLNHQSGLNHCHNENQLSHHLNFSNQSALHHFSSHLNPNQGHSNMPPHHPAFDNHRLINNEFNPKAKHFAEHKFKPNDNSENEDNDENEDRDDEDDDENRSRSASPSRSRSRSGSHSYSPSRSNSSFDTKQPSNSANHAKPLKSQPSSYQPSSKRQKTEPLSPKSSSSSLLSMSSHLPMPNSALGPMQQFQQHQKQLNSFHSAYHSALPPHPLLNPQHQHQQQQQQHNLLNAYAAALAADQQNQSKLMSSLSLMPQFMPGSSSSSSLSSPQLNGKAFAKPNPTSKSRKCDISNIESLIESRALNAESENCDEAKPKEKQFAGLFHPDNSVTSSRSSIDVSSSSSSSCNNSPLKPASLQIESQLNMSQFELNNSKEMLGGAANPANMPPHLLWYLYALSAQSSSTSPADLERLAASMANQNMPFLNKSYNQLFSSPSPISPTEKSTSPNPNKASPRSSHRSQPYPKSKHSTLIESGEQANDDVMDEHIQLKIEHRYDDESKQDEQNSSESNENEENNENGDEDSKQEPKSKLNISFSENSSSSIDNFESNDGNYDEGKANEDTSELKEKTESTNDERSNSPVMSPGSSSSSSYSIRKKQKTN